MTYQKIDYFLKKLAFYMELTQFLMFSVQTEAKKTVFRTKKISKKFDNFSKARVLLFYQQMPNQKIDYFLKKLTFFLELR